MQKPISTRVNHRMAYSPREWKYPEHCESMESNIANGRFIRVAVVLPPLDLQMRQNNCHTNACTLQVGLDEGRTHSLHSLADISKKRPEF
jgi:hypothetical protein